MQTLFDSLLPFKQSLNCERIQTFSVRPVPRIRWTGEPLAGFRAGRTAMTNLETRRLQWRNRQDRQFAAALTQILSEGYRQIDDFPKYVVGPSGDILVYRINAKENKARGRWKKLKCKKNSKFGHLLVVLTNSAGRVRNAPVHALVLEAFVGPRPEGCDARHFPDRNPANNRLENLSWGTRTENSHDRYLHGTMSSKLRVEDIVEIRRRLSTGESIKSVADSFGVVYGSILGIRNGKQWKGIGIESQDVVPTGPGWERA